MDKTIGHKEKWQKIAETWERMRSPGRPSASDIKNYRQLILSKRERGNVLILGSTPELRDMFAELKKEGFPFQVTCVDMVSDMYEAMSKLVKKPNSEEIFVEGNWLELDNYFDENTFNIVIGDWVSVNVGNSLDKFYGGILYVLENDGFFIERAGIIADNTKQINDVYHELQKQAGRVQDKEITKEQAWNYFASSMMMSSWYLNRNNVIDWDSYTKELVELKSSVDASGDIIEKYILDTYLETKASVTGKYWTILRNKDQEKVFEKHFHILESRISDDYDLNKAKESPIYLLGKK